MAQNDNDDSIRTDAHHEIKYVDCSEVKIKMEYARMFGSPSAKELDELRDSIESEGQLTPVIVNQQYILVDGHRRVECLRQLNRKAPVEVRHFTDSVEEIRLIYAANLHRRHLSEFARIEAVVHYEPLFREQARKRQLSNLRQGSSGGSSPLARIQTDGDEPGRSDQRCADLAKVTRHTYVNVRSLLEEGKIPEELKDQLRCGKISLKKGLRPIINEINRDAKKSSFVGESYIISNKIRLIRGAFNCVNEHHILEGSIDLVFPTADYSRNAKP